MDCAWLATLCYVYFHLRYQCTCDAITPDVPSQEVGHWCGISLHMAHVFVDPTPGVPFKISSPLVPPIGPMVRVAHNRSNISEQNAALWLVCHGLLFTFAWCRSCAFGHFFVLIIVSYLSQLTHIALKDSFSQMILGFWLNNLCY